MNKEDIDMLLKYKMEQTIRGKTGFVTRAKIDYPLTDDARKERKRIYNLKQRSDPEKEHARRVKDAETKRVKTENMSLEEREMVRAKDRERKALSKNISKKDKSDSDRENQRVKMAAIREKHSYAEKEFEILEMCIRVRKLRGKRDEEQYLLENLIAKEGMTSFRQLGTLREYQRRKPRDLDDETLWYRFWMKGIEYRKILRIKIPWICDTFEEKEKQSLEKEAKNKEVEEQKRREGIWDYNPTDDCYYWTGDGPPPCSFEEYNGLGEFAPPDMRKLLMERTPEELEEIRKQDEYQSECYRKWFTELSEEKRQEKNRYQRERRAKMKEKLASPIDIPDTELSDYEKLREKNLKEIEEFKLASGLFD